ncbi:MAG TPA: hypothetical protein P5514_06620 [Bacteroidales bacterium]|nr:hypothetical protein [Bacteroidales bacterium]HRX96602.1 hypothetical protein [Bacteroidales bacterium]
MKRFTILFMFGLFVLFQSIEAKAQIYSTTSGGSWNSTTTWIGGVIPGASDNVVINGPVEVVGNACNNLTILAGASLQNSYYSYTLTINGDLYNHGTISNYSSAFTVEIYGDIYNDGVWVNSYSRLKGATNQYLNCLNNNVIGCYQFVNNKTGGDMYINSEVNFQNCQVILNNGNLHIPASAVVNLYNSDVFSGNIIGSGASSILYGDGAYNADPCILMSTNLQNLSINGSLNISSNCSFSGTVINNGFIQNDYYGYEMNIYDNFINNGTLRNYASGLIIYVYGNFTNNNEVLNQSIDFRGSTDQNITLLTGKTLSPVYFSNNKTGGDIVALTDMSFTNSNINFNGGNLKLPENGTISINGGYFINGNLFDQLSSSGYIQIHMENGAYLKSCTVYNPELTGTVEVESNNTFIGDILNSGILHNDYYGYILNVDGNLINDGSIINDASALTLNITGNLTNNGTWSNYYTYLNGTADQHVTCLNSSFFSGSQFNVTNSTGLIYFDTEVNFENTLVHFNGNNLELPTNSKFSVHQSYLTHCNLHGNGATSLVHGAGVYGTDAPYMQQSTFEDVAFTGDWGVGPNITMNGTIINDGILQNAYYSYTTVINADFINNGTIKNYVGGFTLQMYGDFTNNGTWSGHAIDLYGTSDQYITLDYGHYFNPTYFTSFKPSGQIIANSDLKFQNCRINLSGGTLVIPNAALLSIDNNYIQNATVSPISGRFYLLSTNDAYIDNCSITNADLYGETNLTTNTFYGTTVNYGIMQNDYYEYTVTFDGDLINNGTIQHYVGAFVINALGDITNNGTWTNYYTKMNGTTTQHIHLKDGHWIDGQMRLVSDANGSVYQWYRNGNAIISAYPNPDPFGGYTSGTLVFNNPVSSSWLGTYYCYSGGYSRSIIVDQVESTQLDITVFLEGPYNSSTNFMEKDLNTQAYIPLEQPYNPSLPYYNENDPVWTYKGLESVLSVPAGVVDWIVVELRDATTPATASSSTAIYTTAAFLLEDGSVVDLDGSSLLRFDPIQSENLYVVIFHRNHLGVISASGLTESGGIYSYDFSSGAAQAYGGTNGHKELEPGVWGMVAGDGTGNGLIQNTDETAVWKVDLGQSGYKGGDFDMNGLVQNTDETNYWKVNLGAGGQTPDNASGKTFKSYIPE